MSSFVFRCSVCGRLGEREREDEEAIQALLDLVERDGWSVRIEANPEITPHTIRCPDCRLGRNGKS
ncbi:MAG: hypothetical protein ACRD2J_11340 [Thermoanaerobaculia bacterium]